MRADQTIALANFKPHDLLWVTGAAGMVTETLLPAWASRILDESAVVVVRRGHSENGLVPIGIRGRARNERFAAAIPSDRVEKVITPEQLLERNVSPTSRRIAEIPALRWFFKVVSAWEEAACPWGPVGSVGFELATGIGVATSSSDLDLVMRSPSRMSISTARALLAELQTIHGAIDIQIEAPAGSFSLREFLDAGSKRFRVKTPGGSLLIDDPWGKQQGEFG